MPVVETRSREMPLTSTGHRPELQAEYQKASSAVITATTKSGGILDWKRTCRLSEQIDGGKDSFQRADKGFTKPVTTNAGRFEFGGPIVKDKVHIFGSYKAIIESQQSGRYPSTSAGFALWTR